MERTSFCRRIELPGVEMLEVADSQRSWRRVSSTFELMISESWSGQISYRGARHQVAPGMLFCPSPGDPFEISDAASVGSFRVLMIERETFCRSLAKHGLTPEALDLNRVITAIPDELMAALVRLLDDMCSDAEASRLESSMQALISAIAAHLPRHAVGPSRARHAPVAERVRQLLHADEEATLDLGDLSRETGLSRFQVLRAFKRAYGLPPHAYQLCVRIAQAQRLLCLGHRAGYVATELRFADQSHMTRHFKRLLRVTPSEYARAVPSRHHERLRAGGRSTRSLAGPANAVRVEPIDQRAARNAQNLGCL